jgi:hypothetical protein
VAHLDVLGHEDDGHAAGAEPVQHAVVAQHKPEGRPRDDARRLVVGQQAVLDHQFQHLPPILAGEHSLLGRSRQLFPVLGVDEGLGEQFVHEVVADRRRRLGVDRLIELVLKAP